MAPQGCFGEAHGSAGTTKYNMALLHRRRGDDGEARQLFREAAAAYTAAYGAEHPEAADALEQAGR